MADIDFFANTAEFARIFDFYLPVITFLTGKNAEQTNGKEVEGFLHSIKFGLH